MSDAESDAADSQPQWLLGFVDDCEPSLLLRHRFPSKVGGRPAWLEPVHLPSPKELSCGVTGRPLDFLLQVYATPSALDQNPQTFHRMLFLFISPQGAKLAELGAAKAFRCQLPRQNEFYSYDPPKKADKCPPSIEARDTSGAAADRWNVAEAEVAVASGNAPPAQPGVHLYPEWEIAVEPEDDYAGADAADPATQRLLQEYTAQESAGGGLTAEDLPPEVLSAVEQQQTADTRHFASFAAAMASAPEQVLRYCFEPAAVPLWPSPDQVPAVSDIPDCPLCGNPRRFEFQVLPQLLNHLEIEADAPDAPDWGVIAVYTCSISCQPKEGGYAQEFVWVQPAS